MKIIYKKGNLIHASEGVIAHGCNNRGVMGSGVARAIRDAYPEAYDIYKKFYKLHGLELGMIICHYGKPHVVNCITQNGFGKDGKQYVDYAAIRKCMRTINSARYFEVAMPKIGAGLGGGDWNVISKIIEEESLNFQPIVYEL